MTYAGAYGGKERVTVDGLMRREGHALGIRRDEATKIAAAEAAEAASANKRWTFGVAAGALLMAGTFAAGALGITGGGSPVAGSMPEHAPATPGHSPVAGSPAVGASDRQDDKRQTPRPVDPRDQQTTPASAGERAAVPVTAGSGGAGAATQGGGDQRSTPGGSAAETPAPQPAPAPAPQQPAPQQPAPRQQGPLGQVVTPIVDTVDDVLSPVTGVVSGVLSPLSADSSSQRGGPAPAGPALTMINPLGGLLGV